MDAIEGLLSRIAELPPWAALAAIVLATFVSEDLTCVAAGLIAAGGRVSPLFAMVASGLGIFLGDLGLWAAGRWIGQPALRRRPFCWILSDEAVERSEAWFAARGPIVILLGRFVPGSRLPSYFAAGVLGVGFWRFALFALLAVAIWAPLLVGLALLLGHAALTWYARWEALALGVLLGGLAGLWLFARVLVPLVSWRGRRLLLSRWRRLTRWEYWPPWVFYAPVLGYVLLLALRHRSLSLITAVNPGIDAGGFVGESKAEILAGLSPAAAALVARTARIPLELAPEARLERVRAFLAEHGLGYPVVLKPDAGQRGSGVVVARDEDDARAYLEQTRVETLVQEFVPGDEFGVFWYRRPSESRGHVFSITEKVLPRVVGDGLRTVEQLVLDDERAVCMARVHLEHNAARLFEVPAAGCEVELGELGNHCRGALFLDGERHATEELRAAFDRLADGFEGFFFGRFDVRVESVEAFRAGRGLRIIEVNGGTSEATHIYDPGIGLRQAYRVLFEQWRILFSIAAENRERGAPTVTVRELLRRLEAYWLQARGHPRRGRAPDPRSFAGAGNNPGEAGVSGTDPRRDPPRSRPRAGQPTP